MTRRARSFVFGALFAAAAAVVSGQAAPDRNAIPDTPGTGPYPAMKEVDPGLPNHVVYRPANLSALGQRRLGVYVFGNGGCSADGASSRLHLLEVASHGFLVIAPGGIHNGPGRTEGPPRPADFNIETYAPTRPEQLREAIGWALAENGRTGSRYQGLIDPAAVALSGYSCGGVQALTVADDPRVQTMVIMNSGFIAGRQTRMAGMVVDKEALRRLHTPILYVLGGPTDVAYPNGMDDFEKIAHVPVAVADINTGHGGTYWEPNGGAAAQVVVTWLDWQLRKNAEAGRTFLGSSCGLCADSQWTFKSKGLNAAAAAQSPVARGLYNWIHSTGNGERAYAFYRDVLDMELVRNPFGGRAPANAPPVQIRPVSNAAPDPLVWNLTNTKGSRFRNVFMETTNTPFGLELSEFFDIPRSDRAASPWDPGASRLIFHVRDLNAVLSRLEAAGAPRVTTGGAPVDTPDGRAVLVRDPDGYLVQLAQASAAEIAAAGPGPVIRTTIGLTVADTARSLRYYRDLLNFEVGDTRRGTAAELALNGLAGGELRQTPITIAGTKVTVLLDEFVLPPGATAQPFRWKIEDVGSPQFQLQVRDLDALIARTKEAGYRFLSVGAEPIQRGFGRFVFAIDPDGVLVEYVEPTPR
ncbi:MAG: VOC family protein [Vicinamibacterales bacterium]